VRVRLIGSHFGLIHERAVSGLIDHDLPDGKLVHIWKSNFWKPAEIIGFLERKGYFLDRRNSALLRRGVAFPCVASTG
jgi:hypothetical protein